MLRHFCFLALLSLLAVGVSILPALGCSCNISGPACQAYWNTDAVFDATVIDVRPAETYEPQRKMLSITAPHVETTPGAHSRGRNRD